MSAVLFTIGHSTHQAEYFIGLLEQHGINAVCDVRSHPRSRYNPQYNREAIAAALNQRRIAYLFLGKELGARSDSPGCYDADGKILFQKLKSEPLFTHGLARIKRGMRDYCIALMCAEKDPITCHRMILVTRQLRREVSINHILADGGIETNAEAETRLMDALKVHPDLTRDEDQCIEDAYNLQGEEIGYVKTT